MTDARLVGWRALIAEHQGNREAVIRAAGVTRDVLDGAFRRARSSFARECDAAQAAPSGAASVIQAQPNDYSGVVDWRGARPATAPDFERRLIIPDVHLPAHNTHALACVYALVRALQPHRVIQIGDLLNNEAMTRHAPAAPERERFDLGMLAARAFLRNVRAAAPGAEIHLLAGNHEGWCARMTCDFPAFAGSTFDLSVNLGISTWPDDPRVPEFADVKLHRKPETDPLVLGPVGYIHGNRGGAFFAKRYAQDFGPAHGIRQLVVGHHHQLQHWRTPAGYECWGAGWLGDPRHPAFHYASEPRPWWTGVLVQDVSGDIVTTTAVPIQHGRALFGGRLIGAA